jgi:nicotinate-nucleotide adenylyltransferase
MLGIDSFLDIPNWYRPDPLLSLADFVILSRPGSRFADLSDSPYLSIQGKTLRGLDRGMIASFPTSLRGGRAALLINVSPITISATDIRTRIKQGKSIKYLLPAEVESYIISNHIYDFR